VKERDLRREELRGIFAIGVIAALFTVNQLYGKIKILDAPIELLTGYLLSFWFLYIMLMAVGVSDDIFGPLICDICLAGGRFLFMAGVIGSVLLLAVAPLFYFRDHGMTVPYYVGMALLAAFVVYGFATKLRRSLQRSKKRQR
jgi:hypothetical protein